MGLGWTGKLQEKMPQEALAGVAFFAAGFRGALAAAFFFSPGAAAFLAGAALATLALGAAAPGALASGAGAGATAFGAGPVARGVRRAPTFFLAGAFGAVAGDGEAGAA